MKTHMPWQQAGIPWDAIEQAMAHCDRVGRDAFRQEAHSGFKAAKGKGVMHQQRGPDWPSAFGGGGLCDLLPRSAAPWP
ncbi:hypothetical protein [Vreelandella lionensis]|uniref:hypothetical protein n=1 Tax=Vreelandella lionensis TaxID=1144478 RepID=UPI00111C437F|nr:hypothetical protein [Halomonas lionensis]